MKGDTREQPLPKEGPEALRRVAQLAGVDEIPFHKVDLRDRDGLNQVFDNNRFDACIHFAGLKAVGESVAKPWEYYENNIVGTLVLTDVMRRHGCKNIIFSSSATVYGEPERVPLTEDAPVRRASCPYGQTKITVEYLAAELQRACPDFSVVLLRYFNPVGAHESGLIGEDPSGIPNNLMPFICQTAAGVRDHLSMFGNDYPTPAGTCVRDYLHVMDLAEGHVKALEYAVQHQGTEIFNLGTGEGYSVYQVVHAFETVNHLTLNKVDAPRRPGDLPESYADASKAERVLGWKARRSLQDMCRDAWHWQQLNPHGYKKA